LVIDAVRDIQRGKTGLPHIHCSQREVGHPAVTVNKSALLALRITFADNLSGVVHAPRKTRIREIG
jgi:hypothetical protein